MRLGGIYFFEQILSRTEHYDDFYFCFASVRLDLGNLVVVGRTVFFLIYYN